MEELKDKLNILRERNEKLHPIVFVGFNSEKELLAHRKKVEKERNEYYENQEEIEKLELDLMTPDEKEKHDKLMRFLELKAKGKPFDPEAEGLL